MSDKRYILEIYEPDSADDVLTTLDSDEPFMAIEVGTLLTLPDRKDPLEITNVEHIIWSGPNGARHKECIFTKAAPDTREARRRTRSKP
ncbi:MAG: hypothetical protein M3P38_01005 [Chloroflexota bacterium]|nr:hypothetical protein [Chloroflexota bacterium]